MWVVDDSDRKIYAYDLSNGDRQSENDFNSLDAAGNDSPKGLWSDGTTMWVSDNNDNKIYAYEMPTDTALSSLELSGVNLGNFSSAILDYSTRVPNTVTQTTVDAEAAGTGATVSILPADADTNASGHQVNVGSGTTTVTVAVGLGGSVSTYTVEITKVDVAVLSGDSSLSAFELSGVDFAFSSTTTLYRTAVGSTVDSTTVSYTRGDETATVSITPADADTVTAGHQVNFSVGLNTITVALESSDGTSSTSYAVNLVRDTEADFGRVSSKEYPSLWSSQQPDPVDLWSNGTTTWISESDEQKIFAYDAATKARDSAKDIDWLDSVNADSIGIWSDGSTFWVSDWSDEKIYSYDHALETLNSTDTITLASVDVSPRNGSPRSIWSNDETMWVAERTGSHIFAYDLATGDRDTSKEIAVAATQNDEPRGLRSDGVTMWVSDDEDDKLYAYTLATGARVSALDFNTLDAAGNNQPAGIWSDGFTIWVIDSSDDQVYAYNMPKNAQLASLDMSDVALVEFDPASTSITGRAASTVTSTTVTASAVWDDSTVAILPADNDTNTGGHQVALSTGDNTITVTVTNGSTIRTHTMVVTKVASTSLSTDATLTSLALSDVDFGAFAAETLSYNANVDNSVSSTVLTFASNDSAAAVTIDPTDADVNAGGYQINLAEGSNTITVSVAESDGIATQVYTVTVNRAASLTPEGDAADFARDSSNDYPTLGPAHRSKPVDLWSNGTTTWISEADEGKIFAYDAVTKARDSAKDIDWLDPVTGYSIGIWSDGTIFWVSHWADDNIYPYDHASETLILADTIALDSVDVLPRNGSPRSIWSDGETMWVAERTGSHVFAYDVATGDRDTSKEIAVAATPNDEPRGLWSDGVTMWVSDDEDDKLYAYTLATGARASALDFNTLDAASNNRPSGIWSDGVTMWVLDKQDKKVYAYNMPQNALLDSLEMSDVVLPQFDSEETNVAGRVPNTVSSTTVTASAEGSNSTVVILPAESDANTDGHQVVLGIGDTTITVTNGANTQTYTVVVTKIDVATLSSDATLASLALSGVDFGVFAAETVSYDTDVDNSVSSTVLTYASADSAAMVTINPTDADANAAGYQINLAEGSNAITISVTATDGITNPDLHRHRQSGLFVDVRLGRTARL